MALSRKLIGLSAATLFIYFLSWVPLTTVGVMPAYGAAAVKGRVLSPNGPVAKARVRIKGRDNFTLTDKNGRFVLPGPAPLSKKFIVTAGREGYFNNAVQVDRPGQTVEINLNPVYLADQSKYNFNSPQVCGQCHIKTARLWYQSKMSHTTSNPKVLDMYYGTGGDGRRNMGPGFRRDNPSSKGDCAVCHAPSASAASRTPLDLKQAMSIPQNDWNGVSCDFCHKVRKVVSDPSSPSRVKAVLERQSPRTGRSILVFGPYDDVVVPPMAATYNPLFSTGKLCSICHSYFTKVKGGSWNPKQVYSQKEWSGFGLKGSSVLPIQTTYNEWKQWQDGLSSGDPDKGKRCQTCHLSWTKKMLPYDHYVVDGSARNMWGTYRSPENIRPHHFEGSTKAQLQNALSMELEGETKGNQVVIKAHITNSNGGHWVPTGEPMRNVILLVEANDSAGRPLKLIKGGRLPDWAGQGSPGKGNYAGLPGAVFAKVLGDDQGNLNVPSWRATKIVSDNRIRPKTTVTLEYVFALNDPDDEPEAEAKLIYRPAVKPLAQEKQWLVQDTLMISKAW